MNDNEDFAEIISDILIQLHGLDARVGMVEERMKRMESRMDFLLNGW